MGFIVKSVLMGMIAALFLFTFFPHLMAPVVSTPAVKQDNAPLSFASAIKTALPSVVKISTFIPDAKVANKQPTARIGMGSGVIISAQGYIVTNNHVIAGAKEIAIQLNDGRSSIAKVVGVDPVTDLAILHISMDNLPALVMDADINVQVGDIALVIGNPFGVGQSVTMGIVSATDRKHLQISEYENFIQTDAAVNPGNSGGALINTQGDLLGISSAYFTEGTKTGISFAIPTSLVMEVSKQIIFNGRVIRGWLGFSGGPIDKSGREDFGENTYFVESVSKGSPADKSGLKARDVILSMNGQSLTSNLDLQKLIAQSPVGSEISIKVNRANEIITLKAILMERPQAGNR